LSSGATQALSRQQQNPPGSAAQQAGSMFIAGAQSSNPSSQNEAWRQRVRQVMAAETNPVQVQQVIRSPGNEVGSIQHNPGSAAGGNRQAECGNPAGEVTQNDSTESGNLQKTQWYSCRQCSQAPVQALYCNPGRSSNQVPR